VASRGGVSLPSRSVLPVPSGSGNWMTSGNSGFARQSPGAGRRTQTVTTTEALLVAIVGVAIRPHQALGYLTPAEYLASVGIDV
jgi:hypothetical protein